MLLLKLLLPPKYCCTTPMAKALPDGSSLPQQDNSSTTPQKTLQEWRVQGVDVATKLPKFNIG